MTLRVQPVSLPRCGPTLINAALKGLMQGGVMISEGERDQMRSKPLHSSLRASSGLLLRLFLSLAL